MRPVETTNLTRHNKMRFAGHLGATLHAAKRRAWNSLTPSPSGLPVGLIIRLDPQQLSILSDVDLPFLSEQSTREAVLDKIAA